MRITHTRLKQYLLLSTYVVAFYGHAQNSINGGPSYHSDQASDFGFWLGARYQYNHFLETDFSYQYSGDIEKRIGQQLITDNFQSVNLGLLTSRQTSDIQKLYLGGGISYVASADNDLLFESGDSAPYVKLATDWQLSKNTRVELGAINQFSLGELDNSTSFYLNVSWHFGGNSKVSKANTVAYAQQDSYQSTAKVNTITKKEISTNETAQPLTAVSSSSARAEINQEQALATQLPSSPASSKAASPKHTWFIQFGAFTRQSNAEQLVSNLNSKAITAIVKQDGNLFRVLSSAFSNKEQAKVSASKLDRVQSYVIEIK